MHVLQAAADGKTGAGCWRLTFERRTCIMTSQEARLKGSRMPPLVLVATAWIGGLILAHHWLAPLGLEPLSLIILSFLSLAAIIIWRQDRSMRLSGACALALLVGALRYQAALPNWEDPSLVAHYNDSGWVTIEGIVRSYPDVRDTWTNLRLETDQLEIEGEAQPVRGIVLLRAPRFPEHHYGDRLRVSGLLQTPPEFEDYSYKDYLARQGIYSFISRPQIEKIESGQGRPFWTAIYAGKDQARDAIARLVPDPEASLLQGILLGIRSGIPADLYDDYNATGTSHIIVISGANITFVATLFALTFGRIVGRRRAYWFTIAGITLYVLLVGADAAVVRAGIMGGLFVTALYLGRRSTAYVSLFASALVLTLINPLALWDVGFQLSFAATLGLILFAPAIERLFEQGLSRFVPQDRTRWGLRFLNDALILTLAAQILTIPLVVYHFGRLSLVAPVANLLILPVQPPIMSLGAAATLIGVPALAGPMPFLEPLARVVAWVPWLCLAYTNAIVRWMASWPLASLEISRADAGWLVVAYVVITVAVWVWSRRQGPVRRFWDSLTGQRSTAFLLGGASAIAILAWLAVLQLPDGRLHVAFLDVGQGDAIFITTPSGAQILIDGGPSPSALSSALGREMPFWDRSLDLIVMTHPDADHITGLAEVLGRYRVAGWLDNGLSEDDTVLAECQQRLTEADVPRQVVRAGDRLELESGIVLEILHPPPDLEAGSKSDPNNSSLVLRLVWDRASFLFTGDIEAEAEQLLMQSGQSLSSSVLKVAHHGSAGSSTESFLTAANPSYAVISVGADNRFDHPHQAVLERLEQLDSVTTLRTDELGTIEFVTNGKQMWWRTE
jgi:competence protein ComEC